MSWQGVSDGSKEGWRKLGGEDRKAGDEDSLEPLRFIDLSTITDYTANLDIHELICGERDRRTTIT